MTGSANFPVTPGAYDPTRNYSDDAFVSKLTHDLAADPPCRHHGDVNYDGSVTGEDAMRAFLIALKLEIPLTWQGCAADCNGDGFVTAGDAQRIFSAGLGLAACAQPLHGTSTGAGLTPGREPVKGRDADQSHR